MANKTSNNAYSGPLVSLGPGYEGSEGIWGPVWDQSEGGHSEVNLRSIWDPILDPILGNLIKPQELASFGRG